MTSSRRTAPEPGESSARLARIEFGRRAGHLLPNLSLPHRIGQTLPVTVYRLVIKDSIEQKILALHATRRALSADFLDGADQAGALGEEELMALIRG